MLQVRRSRPANWLTEAGVYRKRRMIELKGIPDFKHWRFLTLTLDQKAQGDDPISAFQNARVRLKTFTRDLQRAGLLHEEPRWCRKLEFHPESGWPHWHMLLDRTRRYSKAQLLKITEVWGLGRTNVEMIGGKKHGAGHAEAFIYTFKYAFKPAFMQMEDWEEGERECAPAWFANYREVIDGKPVTFSRVRFWQTSRGNFYTTKAEPKAPKPLTAEQTEFLLMATPEQLDSYTGTWQSYVPFTVSEIYHDFQKPSLILIARDAEGKYIRSGTVRLLTRDALAFDHSASFRSRADAPQTYEDFHQFRRGLGVHEHRRDGQAVILDAENWFVASNKLTKEIQEPWKLQLLQKTNKMTLRRARRLSFCNLTLAKC